MERRFGHDFSQVRVLTDTTAADSARAVNALAYTVGSDVVFGAAQYAPGTSSGRRLLAHELTHVLQQRTGATQLGARIGQAVDVHEQEADRIAEQMVYAQGHLSERPGVPITKDTQGAVRLKPAPKLPVPEWYQLPELAQADLLAGGFKRFWDERDDPEVRLTVLNLYVKLKGMDLWRFVDRDRGTAKGVLNFESPDVDGLKKTLTDREDFRNPERSDEKWSSREYRAVGQLHFKHHKNWPKGWVEAHIDPHGLYMASKWWWIIPPVQLVEMLIHGLTKEQYTDVYGIRDILLRQGWWPEPLIGVRVRGDYPLPDSSLGATGIT